MRKQAKDINTYFLDEKISMANKQDEACKFINNWENTN